MRHGDMCSIMLRSRVIFTAYGRKRGSWRGRPIQDIRACAFSYGLKGLFPGQFWGTGAVEDPGFESRGGGGAWNSNAPKLVIATRSRRGPALAPSRGSGGMLPREILKIAMRRYAFFTILGYNFRKIRERISKVICTYIYNFYKIFEVTGKIRKIKKRCSTWRKSCIQRSTQQHSSWMFMPVCRHHFFKIQVYVLVDIQAQQCIQAPLRHHAAVVWLDESQGRFFFSFSFSSSSSSFFFFFAGTGGGASPLDPLLRWQWRARQASLRRYDTTFDGPNYFWQKKKKILKETKYDQRVVAPRVCHTELVFSLRTWANVWPKTIPAKTWHTRIMIVTSGCSCPA